MRKEYESLLNEIEEISRHCYNLSEVLYGYCEYIDGDGISSFMINGFFKEIKEKQLEIINLIDKKTTEIGHELYLKQNTQK